MDHNPFISRNNDLFIMLIAGCAMAFTTRYLYSLSVQEQFIVMTGFGYMAGLFASYLYQSLEWAFFFALGVLLVFLTPLGFLAYQTGQLPLAQIIATSIESGQYSLFLLSSWIISIPTGLMTQKLLMGDYYRRNTL